MTPPKSQETILVGFELGTGDPVALGSPAHTIITGMTGHGKTALVDALAERWEGQKFIVFLTKEGEEQFETRPRIKAFYKQRPTADWRFLRDLLEVSESRKLRQDESALLAQLTPGTRTLQDVLDKVEDRLAQLTKKNQTESYKYNLFFLLKEYLKKLIADVAKQSFATTLELKPGVTVMDLSQLSRVMQAAVIGSTLEEIHKHHRDTSPVIPEAWTFLPGGRGSPALDPAEFIVRQGRVKGNYLIIDTQDLAGVNGERIRANIHNYFLGRQQYDHEVERTLKALSLPPADKPRPDQIMRLRKGQFYAVLGDAVRLIYAWPVWLDQDQARNVAMTGSTTGDVGALKERLDEQLDRTPHPAPQKGDPGIDASAQFPDALVQGLEAKVAELNDKLAKADADRAELQKTTTAQQDAITKLLEEVEEKSKALEVFEPLRKYIDERATRATGNTHLAQSAGQVDVHDTTAQVTVHDKREPVQFDQGSVESNVCLLVADGFFSAPRNLRDVHVEYARHYELAARNHPDDAKHSAEWRKNKLEPVLDMLAQRRYRVLVKDGAIYVEGPNKIRRAEVPA